MATPLNPASSLPIKVFISHAHNDHLAAKQLIDFLVTEFDLSPHEIRCTSATDAANRLELGKSIGEQLRKDLHEAQLVIGLLSYFGLNSVWVKFELGAAWGQQKKLIPIIGPDFGDDLERLGPLGSDFHLSVDDPMFDATLLSHFRMEMERLEIAAKNDNASIEKLTLFTETYRQYGGINSDFLATKFSVISPRPGDIIGGDIVVKFEVANLPKNGFIWFGVMPKGKGGMFWPKEVNDEKEQIIVFQEGGASLPGSMAIGVVGVGIAGNAYIKNWMERGNSGKGFPGLCFSKILPNTGVIPGAVILGLVENLTLKNP